MTPVAAIEATVVLYVPTILLVAAFGATMLAAAVQTAQAGSFVLMEGKRYELCRAYDKNLKSFPNLSEITEEWPLDPKLRDFKKPRWETADVSQHLDVIRKLYVWANRPFASSTPFSEEREMESDAVPNGIANGTMRFERARVDFDNDGQLDIVYRFYHPVPDSVRSPDIKQANGYWYIYFDHKGVSESFRRHSGRDALYDSFFFRGRFYLIGWFGYLSIFEPHITASSNVLSLTPVCRFKYVL